METKALLYGLIGFFLGGLLVSVVATTMEKPDADEMSMSQMTKSLKTLNGNEYDKAFITHMTDHHQAAVEMAKLSAKRAGHQEIKDMSRDIISAQEKEISMMKQWQAAWGYEVSGKQQAHPTH